MSVTNLHKRKPSKYKEGCEEIKQSFDKLTVHNIIKLIKYKHQVVWSVDDVIRAMEELDVTPLFPEQLRKGGGV